MTHDYKRHGSATLFAALELLQGRVIGQCYARHRHQEFLKFLQRLEEEFPGEVPLHLVMENYGTHKQPKVRAWWKRHPGLCAHFVHTSSSWLNLVERWFGELTPKRVRRDSFRSLEDLEQAIREFLATWNIGIAYTSVTHFRFSRRFERGTKMPEQHTILGGKVRVYKRPNSSLWYCSSYFAGKNRRTSTHEESLSKAKEIAEDWYLQLRGKLRAGEVKSERRVCRVP